MWSIRQRRRTIRLLSLALVIAFAAVNRSAAQAPDPRGGPLAIEDALQTAFFPRHTQIVLSRNGEMVAYTVRRPTRWLEGAKEERFSEYSPTGVFIEGTACDVWVADTRNGQTTNLTNGRGSNWAPAWSPDGEQLAFYSDRAGTAQPFLYSFGSVQHLRRVRIAVLGPQRRTTAARTAVAELIPTGSVATINAGWREREAADAELGEVLGGRMVNLRLYQRWSELIAADSEYAAAERKLPSDLEEQQAVYAVAAVPRVAALDEVNRRDKMPAVRAAAVADGIRALRALDAWHLDEVAASRQQFYRTTQIGERQNVAEHRRQLAELVDDELRDGDHRRARGRAVHLLHVFGLAAMIKTPVITWSAGAMALSDRVVLFGAHRPAGRRLPEVWADGLGAFSGGAAVPAPTAPTADARPVPAGPAGPPVQGLDLPAVRRRRPGRSD